MKDLFVNKDGVTDISTIAGTWLAIDSTAPEDTTKGLLLGSLGFFDVGGITDGAKSSGASPSDAIRIGTRLPGGAVKYSVPIYKNSKLSEQVYVPPIAAKKALGASKDAAEAAANGSLNLPTTFKVGETAQFSIRDLSKGMHDETAIEIYSTVFKSGDDGDSLINRLIEAVSNNDVSCVKTPVATMITPDATVPPTVPAPPKHIDGIQFESKVPGKDFAIMLLSGTLQYADLLESNMKNGKIITTPPPPTSPDGLIESEVGQGTPDQMRQAEKVASTRDGATHTQVLTKYMSGPPSLIEDVNYHQLVVSHITPRSDEIMRENNPMQSLMIIGKSALIVKVMALLAAYLD